MSNGYGLHIPLETVLGFIPGTPQNKAIKLERQLQQAQLDWLKQQPAFKQKELDLQNLALATQRRGQWFGLGERLAGPLLERLWPSPLETRQLDIAQQGVGAQRLGHWLDFAGRLGSVGLGHLLGQPKQPDANLFFLAHQLSGMSNLSPAQLALRNKLFSTLGIELPQEQSTAAPNVGSVDEAAAEATEPSEISKFFRGLFKKPQTSPSIPMFPMQLLNPFVGGFYK